MSVTDGRRRSSSCSTPGRLELWRGLRYGVERGRRSDRNQLAQEKNDIGDLCLEYEGGGHAAAGTCQVDHEDAERVLGELVSALQDESPEVVQAAFQVLERHAPSGVIPEVIVAIKRLASMRLGDSDQAAMAGYLATLLRDSKRWHLTQEQRAQLADALPAKKGRSP